MRIVSSRSHASENSQLIEGALTLVLPDVHQVFGAHVVADRLALGRAPIADLHRVLVIERHSPEGGLRPVDRIARDRKSTRLNSSHSGESRMPSSA